jgi:hypothetical protein
MRCLLGCEKIDMRAISTKFLEEFRLPDATPPVDNDEI